MVDFLRTNTWCSRNEYLWGLTVGQVRLAQMDYSHAEYFDEKDRKPVSNIRNAEDLKNLNDLGVPIINK